MTAPVRDALVTAWRRGDDMTTLALRHSVSRLTVAQTLARAGISARQRRARRGWRRGRWLGPVAD